MTKVSLAVTSPLETVWLNVPAVKQGRTRKLSSILCRPYTIIDRVGVINYSIQLIVGSPKTLVVHRKRLKLCYREPASQRQGKANSLKKEKISIQDNSLATSTSKPTCADVVVNQIFTSVKGPLKVGGYICSTDELPRPQQTHQPLPWTIIRLP